ncbi:hypothetical protein [Novosphingobium sp. KN65.2]|uniref:hypothetical protein n=1 Tax=Novosphingobium sp. KN65.2 TaxID=1478134 RepID=UPI0005E9134C|nr:hypothetical protein [Novosphingobium sp. KN65.2]CDO36922.1 hypothetical protein SPHV1_2430004 [Novosphingobium sp. KN65.2]
MAQEESDEFDRLMMALGSIVVMWGMVEDMVRQFLRDVVMEDAEEPEIERIIISQTSFRSQLDVLKKVAHVRWPNSEWFDAVNEQVKALKGPLQDKRNRFIHDLWEKNEAGQMVKFIRGKDEAAVQKKEGEWHLKLTGEVAVPVAEVEAFFEEIADTLEALLALKSQYVEKTYKAKAAAIISRMYGELAEKVHGNAQDDEGAK